MNEDKSEMHAECLLITGRLLNRLHLIMNAVTVFNFSLF